MFDIDDVLAREAERLRNSYYLQRSLFCLGRGRPDPGPGARVNVRWEGGVDALGRSHEPVWPRVLRFAAHGGVSPAGLVQAAFNGVKGGQPPPPTVLLAGKTLAAAREAAAAGRAAEEHQLTLRLRFYGSQVVTYHTSFSTREGLGPEETWQVVIVSDPPALSPLFRYCLARQAGFDGLAERYGPAALEEYLWAEDSYDAAWREVIAPDLREAAGAVRARLKAG
jgi:hypothetical protein